MEKVKITKEQADRISELKMLHGSEYLIRSRIYGFGVPKNKCLNNLTLDELAKALYIGYEIIVPPVPELFTGKVTVLFNNDIKKLTENKEFFLKIDKRYDAFSIQEFTQIRDTMTDLLEYYNDYVN